MEGFSGLLFQNTWSFVANLKSKDNKLAEMTSKAVDLKERFDNVRYYRFGIPTPHLVPSD
jgi:hypothetical protein